MVVATQLKFFLVKNLTNSPTKKKNKKENAIEFTDAARILSFFLQQIIVYITTHEVSLKFTVFTISNIYSEREKELYNMGRL